MADKKPRLSKLPVPSPAGHTTNGDTRPRYEMTSQQFAQFCENVSLAREQFFRRFFDPRRSIFDECGYPQTTGFDGEQFFDLYDREPIGTRVVELFPKESWKVEPTVYEDEDSESVTPFEEAWDALDENLRGVQSHYKPEAGSIVWEYLYRADMLSGIGSFGIILLGIDDGKLLQDPVDGVPLDGRAKDISGVSQIQTAPTQSPPSTQIGDSYKTSDPNTDDTTESDKDDDVSRALESKEIDTAQNPDYAVAGKDDSPATADASDVSKDIYGGQMGDTSYPLVSRMGTDALYRGTQFTVLPPEDAAGKPARKDAKLLFIRCFDEHLVQVVQYEADMTNPRFGQPVMYLVTLNDPRQPHTGVGLPLATVRVHWSRVIHLADNLTSSEVFGVPRMRPVLNPILDIQKVRGGSAEMYWKGAFPGISVETHPQLGGDVSIDTAGIRDMMENWMNGLQRYMAFSGMAAKTLSPQVVDPEKQIQVQIEAICIKLGCPKRVFMGSERGELASSQDDEQWNDQIRYRQHNYVTPRIIVPFIDRLIAIGVLPEPSEENGYKVEWPDLEAIGKKDKAAIAFQMTQAIAAYISGNCESLLPPFDFMTRILEMEEDQVQEILDAAQKELKKKQDEAADQGMVPTPPPGMQHPPQPPMIGGKPGAFGGGGGGPPGAQGNAPQPQPKQPKPPADDDEDTSTADDDSESTTENLWDEDYSILDNVFCPTGPGGGVDATCSPGGHPTTGPELAKAMGVKGEGTKENPYRCGADIKTAAKLLAAGHHIELAQPDQIATLTDKMAKMINKAVKSGEKPPDFDLCKVSSPGTNLFCQETLGIPRIQMPQMRGIPVPGTHAATLKASKKTGKVDLSAEFIDHMKANGISTTEESISASHLRASQSQIVGSRVVQLVNEANAGTRDLREKPIFVTRDNYIVDGHHHWAADVAYNYQHGKDYKIPVHKLDCDIGKALDMANEFTKAQGLAPKSGATK